jgi:hypothetical protein
VYYLTYKVHHLWHQLPSLHAKEFKVVYYLTIRSGVTLSVSYFTLRQDTK